MKSRVVRRWAEVNKEWWLLLSLFVIAAALNIMSSRNDMLLGLYTLPTLASAYFFGRRHATLTAVASVLLVLAGYFFGMPVWLGQSQWYEVAMWGALLVVTGYAVGTLFRELHETYRGILLILEHLISRDLDAQDHALRISSYARAVAEEMKLDDDKIEDIRTTALLHDLAKLGISREIIAKAAFITAGGDSKPSGENKLAPLSLLKRIVPILLASQYASSRDNEQDKLAAEIIAIADEYELLTSDRDGRNALTPSAALKIIVRNAQDRFSPKVLDAFLAVAEQGQFNAEMAMN